LSFCRTWLAGVSIFVQTGLSEILQGKRADRENVDSAEVLSDANKDLSEFTGHYKETGGSETDLRVKDGYLFASDIKLYSVKPDCFFDFKYFGEAVLQRDAAGKGRGNSMEGADIRAQLESAIGDAEFRKK
jgi:hypothetical protein